MIETSEKQTKSYSKNEEQDKHKLQRYVTKAAKTQAENILQNSNAIIENTIREIRENQAEKERTKEARQQLDDFKTNLDTEQKQEKDELIEKKMRQIQDRKKKMC